MKTATVSGMVVLGLIALGSTAAFGMRESGGGAASPAIFTIVDTAGVSSDDVGNDGSEPYTDRSLGGGDACVDAFAGRANTFMAVHWSEDEGWDCSGQVRRFTLTMPYAAATSNPCQVLGLDDDGGVCRITSGPPDLPGVSYGDRSFRIRASTLFVARAVGTRVDFLLEVGGVPYEIRTDDSVPFTGTASSRTVTSAGTSTIWGYNRSRKRWEPASAAFPLPFEIKVTIP